MTQKKIYLFYGTRPEFIKMAPVINLIKTDSRFLLTVIHTGQHKDLTIELENLFGIKPDIKFNTMENGQSINYLLSKIIRFTQDLFDKQLPDLVLVQGDTTTVLGVSIASFYSKVKIGHIEAGLRSNNMQEPFPEEFNRRITTLATHYHFAPTTLAVNNLLNEGIDKQNIYLTGNTVVDAALSVSNNLKFEASSQKTILITCHRRENHGEALLNICNAIKILAKKYPNLNFIWPVHPNPNVFPIVHENLSQIINVNLVLPLSYSDLIKAIMDCTLVWTDSGGIQEEVPTFKKPVLILRNVTERPEVVESGFGILVGTDTDKLVKTTSQMLDDSSIINKMTRGSNPFGDGKASNKIVEICAQN